MLRADFNDDSMNDAGSAVPARPRWVVAKTSRLAHLDLGERSSQSIRVKSEHVIVTACRAHIDADAPEVPGTYPRRCSNCVREALT
jgi:hypothetical protein